MLHLSVFSRFVVGGLLCLGVLSLDGCGGGGGGGGGGSRENNSPPLLTFAPAAIGETVGEGDSLTLPIVVTPGSGLTETVYIAIVDTVGVITPQVELEAKNDGSFLAYLHTSPDLNEGEYRGALEVRLCKDTSCSSQFKGSPLQLNYVINVLPDQNLTPLASLGLAADWGMEQGNAAHTGYVPVTLNPANFTPRWRWANTGTGILTSQVVVENGTAFVVVADDPGRPHVIGDYDYTQLIALDEADGAEKWNYEISGLTDPFQPAVANGKIYFAHGSYSYNSILTALSADSGVALFNKSMSPASLIDTGSPTIEGGNVYYADGYGLRSFNADTGEQNWFTQEVCRCTGWSPVVSGNAVYAMYSGGGFFSPGPARGLAILQASDGQRLGAISDLMPAGGLQGDIGILPMLTDSGAVVALTEKNTFIHPETGVPTQFRRLNHFTPSNMTLDWSIIGNFVVQPAAANGVVYVAVGNGTLEAHDEATGAMLWTWKSQRPDETTMSYNVAVTDNLVFVSTNRYVHAIDLTTHQSVWQFWKPGRVSISNSGVLYVTSDDGVVWAVNLQ